RSIQQLYAVIAGNNSSTERYARIVKSVLTWLMSQHSTHHAINFLLDVAEICVAMLPARTFQSNGRRVNHDAGWRNYSSFLFPIQLIRCQRRLSLAVWSAEQQTRYWHLLRWIDEPGPGQLRLRPELDELLAAYSVRAATDADVYEHLL